MSKIEIISILKRIDVLVSEIQQFVPPETKGSADFRGDLGGLLVVSIASSYESCVKETLVNYASSCHLKFGEFASKNYEKLNSRISLKDLFSYTKLFNNEINIKFKSNHRIIQNRILRFTGQDIEKEYEKLLSWRHAYAHSGAKLTTIEEAYKTHRRAKWVLIGFNTSFN